MNRSRPFPELLVAFLTLASVAGCSSDETSSPAPDTLTADAPGADAAADAAADVSTDLGPLPAPPEPPTQWTVPDGEEGSNATCTSLVDDDDNGYTDCDDRNCTDNAWTGVCASLENDDTRCSDGFDNLEAPLGGFPVADGLVDCDDPDCGKNPFVTVCPHLPPEGWGVGRCNDGLDDDGDGATDCDDLDCLLAPGSACGTGGRARLLFDAAHGQTAGGADWLIDVAWPFPRPSQPMAETDWAGAYSDMAIAAVRTGSFVAFAHQRLDGALRDEPGTATALSRADVLVLVEPSSHYTDAEAEALAAFVQAGGGLFLIGNHAGADRDNNGVDAYAAFNHLLERFGDGTLENNPLGFWFENVDYDAAQALDDAALGEASNLTETPHPVLNGAGGVVNALAMYVGTTLGIAPASAAEGLVWILEAPGSPTGAFAVVSTWGSGRIVAVGDSAAFSDTTNSHGITFGSVGLDGKDNRAFALNALHWLAGR